MKHPAYMPRASLLALICAVILVACSREPDAGGPNTPATAETSATITPAPTTAVPTPTPSPRPSPTEPADAITVADQTLADDGRLVFDRVRTAADGWIVVRADEAGEPGRLLGLAPLEPGSNENVEVVIDPLAASPRLFATLHRDEGEPGTFEFPGPDAPVRSGGELVQADFAVELQATLPLLTVGDQAVAEDGVVTIASVLAVRPGWVLLYLDEAGEPGRVAGFAPVAAGETTDLAVWVDWRAATPILHAALHEDGGEPGRYEDPETDPPVSVAGSPVAATFRATFPPDVLVLDQPVVGGAILVERAVSNGPGWLAVYQDEAGQPIRVIGWAALDDGLNEDVVVEVTETAVTPVLHLILHRDDEPVGEFDFPAADPAAQYDGRVPNPFSFRTDYGNYLFVRDQPLSAGDTVTVSLTVVDVDGWMAIHRDDGGRPGAVIGRTWIPAGYNRDIVVEIDPDQATPILFAMLHQDVGAKQEFEFPDGVDIPMQRNRAIIQAPFALLEPDEGSAP